MKATRILLGFALVCGALAMIVMLEPGRAVGYETYNPGGSGNGGCAQCHDGFIDRGPAHGAHSGSSDPAGSCSYCHKSVGDNPEIGSSGKDPDHGCNGCHSGVGLRAHHANAGAPTDGSGLSCADCHSNDPVAPGENVVPVFYGLTDINVYDPCRRLVTNGGEDFDGDHKGLDNDGDLLYDFEDPDCAFVPNDTPSWSSLKGFYR